MKQKSNENNTNNILMRIKNELAGVSNDSEAEAEIILSAVLKQSRESIRGSLKNEVLRRELSKILSIVSKRKKGMPLGYALGCVNFLGSEININRGVLIPRTETEDLVFKAVELLKKKDKSLKIAEVGTGSGCISIAIAKRLPKASITAIDNSSRALNIAKKNIVNTGLEKKIKLLKNDLIEGVKENFDLIIANLLYIPWGRKNFLDKSVLDWEPHVALFGGVDGFDFYRKLFKEIVMQKNLKKKSLILVEIDDSHGIIAQIEAKKFFPSSRIKISKDKSGFTRYLEIKSVMILT